MFLLPLSDEKQYYCREILIICGKINIKKYLCRLRTNFELSQITLCHIFQALDLKTSEPCQTCQVIKIILVYYARRNFQSLFSCGQKFGVYATKFSVGMLRLSHNCLQLPWLPCAPNCFKAATKWTSGGRCLDCNTEFSPLKHWEILY